LSSTSTITLAGANETYGGFTNNQVVTAVSRRGGCICARHHLGERRERCNDFRRRGLASVASSRASLGAYQNRFASTIANLQTTSENLSASRSRIQDADFAAETAVLTRGQILQQAGVAMLAQANALPQNVLALIRG
jgi:flagellin